MENQTKTFSKALYNAHDHAGKQFVAKVLRKKYGEDFEGTDLSKNALELYLNNQFEFH